jgi:creatinine amidohydrolase/Fe(II)-dependent formamide hydrolase-like protein
MARGEPATPWFDSSISRFASTFTRLLPIVLVFLITPAVASAQVLDLRTLNTAQIAALDRARTAVILPGGILEQHGPYLPSYTDGYRGERLARDLAEAIAARAGWTVVMFPPIPLGNSGANMIGGKQRFTGTYVVRASTLRAIFMDLAMELGEQGFRWVFVVHPHGAPSHNQALDEAGDFFHDTYGGWMVHLTGLWLGGCCDAQALLTEAGRQEDGFTVHAGATETSSVLFHRPDLVSPDVARAPAFTGAELADLVEIARRPSWPGYFGAPRHATAAIGAALHARQSAALIDFALQVLDGRDPSREQRYAPTMLAIPAAADVVEAVRQHELAVEAAQARWLAQRKLEPTCAAPPAPSAPARP